MITATAQTFQEWRMRSRELLNLHVAPHAVYWSSEQSLFVSMAEQISRGQDPCLAVTKKFLQLAQVAALHQGRERWNLLYQIAYRLTHGERHLLEIDVDADVRQLQLMVKAVTRDMHKMKAFVRFRKVQGAEPEQLVAWHHPDHAIVEAMAPWFRDRFGNMRWSILTPERSAHWDLLHLSFGPGVPRSDAPVEDGLEDLWRDYYAAIFNPARVKVKAMRAEMPVRYWPTLPEAQLIPQLLERAEARVVQMAKQQKPSAEPWVPKTGDLTVLREAAPSCRGCSLYEHATQVVFGEGPRESY